MQELPICGSASTERSITQHTHAEQWEVKGLLEMATKTSNCPVAVLCVTNNTDFSLHEKFGFSINTTAEKILVAKAARCFQDAGYVSGNPTEDPTILFYAAVTICLPQYNLIGAISVFDSEEKTLSEQQMGMLRLMARQVEQLLDLQWKNNELRKEARAQVILKTSAIRKHLLVQEKQKEEIATKLHEQLAQKLASYKMYLQVAEESEQMRLPLIKKTNENLGILIAEVCKLSEDISPHNLNKMPLEELVKDLITEIKTGRDIDVEFTIAGDIDNICYEPRMVLFRIIERWTKMLVFKDDVTKIRIQISNFDTTIVKILDDSSHHNTTEIANDSTTIKMENRIEMLGGSGKLTHLRPRGNALTIEI